MRADVVKKMIVEYLIYEKVLWLYSNKYILWLWRSCHSMEVSVEILLGFALLLSGVALAAAIITLRLRRLARGLYTGTVVPHDYGEETWPACNVSSVDATCGRSTHQTTSTSERWSTPASTVRIASSHTRCGCALTGSAHTTLRQTIAIGAVQSCDDPIVTPPRAAVSHYTPLVDGCFFLYLSTHVVVLLSILCYSLFSQWFFERRRRFDYHAAR